MEKLLTLRRATGLWCVFLVLLFAHRGLYAQSIQSGTLSGVVKDPDGAVVPDAKVNLRNAVTGYDKNTVTDTAGAYRFNNIPQNNYRLTVGSARLCPYQPDHRCPQFPADSRGHHAEPCRGIHHAQRDHIGGCGGNRSVYPPGRGPQRFPETAGHGPGCTTQPGDYVQQRRCGGGRQRLLSSAGRSRAGELHD